MTQAIETPDSTSPFDICVIGAGAAGLVLVDILSRKGLRICLLEAGPDNFKDRNEPFQVRNLLKEHLGVNNDRVTAFGGATNLWGGGLIRLSPGDFEPLADRPDTAWPLPFASLTRHYQAVESIFGFSPAAEGPANVVFDRSDVCVRRREIPVLPFRSKNFGNRFGPSLRARLNVTILCNSKILRFVPGGEGGISHLQVQIADGSPQQIRAFRYVIAAGTVNSNLLVEQLLADCGTKDVRGEHGHFFHDHLSFPIAIVKPKSAFKFSRRFGYRFERGMMFGEHFDIEAKGTRLPGAFLHLAFDMSTSSILRPVREILNTIQRRTFAGSLLSFKDILPLLLGLPRLGIVRFGFGRLYIDPGATILASIDLEQFALKQWKIGPGADGSVCDLAWDVTPEDAAVAAKFIPVCRDILNCLKKEADFDTQDLLGEVPNDPAKLLEHIRKHAKDTSHSSGGLRMSAAPGALVDPQLRISPIPNVHVLSSAVFPRVGTSNSTHTILALGHRLAEHLIEQVAARK